MSRQPTLAEILADDTGTIRAEVADLLLEHPAPQAQAAHHARPRRQFIARNWIVYGLIVLLLCLVFSALKDLNHSTQSSAESLAIGRHSNSAVDTRAVADLRTGKTGRVIGDSVIIRTQPNLQGEIISLANQNEILNVISFHNGWYKVALSSQGSGYIFGAYFLPQDFNSYPYEIVITKDNQTKLLVNKGDDPLYFTVLRPDGQTTRILKEDVAIYN